MFKNLNCLIGIINTELIFKFRNSNVDLKDNFVNNCKKSNVRNIYVPRL